MKRKSDLERRVCDKVNRSLALQSLLYDLDLLPEQLKRGTREWAIMAVIVELFPVPKRKR